MGKLPVFTNTEQARSGGLLRHSDISGRQAGSGIGGALQGLGGALGGVADALKSRQNEKNATMSRIQLADFTTRAQNQLVDTAMSAPADGSGVTDNFQGWWDENTAEFIGNATDEEDRRWRQERVATLSASMFPKAYVFEAERAAGFAKDQTNEALDGFYKMIRRDPTTFETALEQGRDLINNHYALRDGADREALADSFTTTAAKTYFDTIINEASTLNETEAVRQQLSSDENPAANMLTSDDLAVLQASLARQENGISTGLLARTTAEAEAVIAALDDGQRVPKEHLSRVTQSVLQHGDPELVRRYTETLNVSKNYDALWGSPVGELGQASKSGTRPSDVNIFWRSQGRGGTGYVPVSPSSDQVRQVNPEVLGAVRNAWSALGLNELRINSGFRDEAKNRAVKGAKHSQHLHGNALDIDVSQYNEAERVQIIRALSAAGITGIGVYNTAIHADIGNRRAWGPSFGKESIPGWASSAIQDHLNGVTTPTRSFHRFVVPEVLQPAIESAASENGVPIGILLGVLSKESGNFRPDIVSGETASPAGARGVAQFMPSTAAEWGVNVFDPKSSVRGAGRYLRWLHDQTGSWEGALAAYNWGIGKYRAAGGDLSKAPKETKDYVSTIMGWQTGEVAPPSGLSNYYRSKAAKNVEKAYRDGMAGDATAFTLDYVPQFFTDDNVDVTTGEGLGARFKGINAARDYLGEPDIPLMTEDEVRRLTGSIDRMGGDERLALATQVQRELGANAGEFYKQIEKTHKPMAWAGLMMAHDPASISTAHEIILGGDAVRAKFGDNADKEMRDHFEDTLEVDSRMPSDIMQVLSAYPRRLEDAQFVADQLYTFRSMRDGFFDKFDADKYRQAFEDVLGAQVDEVNGAPMLLPSGVTADDMETVISALTPSDLEKLSVKGGAPVYASITAEGEVVPMPVDIDDFQNEAQFDAYGPNTYSVRLRLGGDELMDSEALEAAGRPTEDALYLVNLSPDSISEIIERGQRASTPDDRPLDEPDPVTVGASDAASKMIESTVSTGEAITPDVVASFYDALGDSTEPGDIDRFLQETTRQLPVTGEQRQQTINMLKRNVHSVLWSPAHDATAAQMRDGYLERLKILFPNVERLDEVADAMRLLSIQRRREGKRPLAVGALMKTTVIKRWLEISR